MGHTPAVDHPYVKANDSTFRQRMYALISKDDPENAVRKYDAMIRGEEGPMGARWALKNRPVWR